MVSAPHCIVHIKQYTYVNNYLELTLKMMVDTGSTHSYIHSRKLMPELKLENVHYTVGNITQQNMLTITKV